MQFSILCEGCTPEDVQRYIEEQPHASLQTRDDDWRVSYGFGENTFLDIMWLAEANGQPALETQRRSLEELVRNHAPDSRRDELLTTLARYTFVLTILTEPEINSWEDMRLNAIATYASEFGKLIATDAGLFAPDLQALVTSESGWGRRFIAPMIETCTLYFPMEEVPFMELLPSAKMRGGLIRKKRVEFKTAEGTILLNIASHDLEEHKQGFLGYVSTLRNSGEARSQAQAAIRQVKRNAGVILPGPISPHGPAFAALMSLLRETNGFIFVANSIMLADGTFLVGPMAPDDPQLERPAEPESREVDPDEYRHEGAREGISPKIVARRERHYVMLAERGFICARWLPLVRHEVNALRPIEEIAARAIALKVLFFWVAGPEDLTEKLKTAIVEHSLRDFLTADEAEILDLAREEANAQHSDQIGWRLENIWALCWVLGYDKEPRFYDGQITDDIMREMLIQFLPRGETSVAEFVSTVTSRDYAEVDALEDLFYCTHNAVRSAQSGSADAVPADFHPIAAGNAIHERRHSLTWALSPGVNWDDTDLST